MLSAGRDVFPARAGMNRRQRAGPPRRRFGDSLAWVEAPTAVAAVERSLELHPLGDWTDDAGELLVFAQDAYPKNAEPGR